MRPKQVYIDQSVEIVAKTLSAKDTDYAGTTEETDVFDNFNFMGDFAGDSDAEKSFRYEIGKKVRRLRNIFREEREPTNESIFESLRDLAGYSVLYMAWLIAQGRDTDLAQAKPENGQDWFLWARENGVIPDPTPRNNVDDIPF